MSLNKINTKTNTFILIILSLACIVVPFITRDKSETTNSILSLIFTALSTLSSIVTLVIAFVLYSRFGLEGKFVENQTNQVLKLVDAIKGRAISINSGQFTY